MKVVKDKETGLERAEISLKMFSVLCGPVSGLGVEKYPLLCRTVSI